jgi:hypothetical protein
MLGFSFALIFTCAKASLAKKAKYPKVNCEDFVDEYRDRLDHWEIDAVVEYKINSNAMMRNEETHYSGAMQCFCQHQKSEGVPNDEVYQ